MTNLRILTGQKLGRLVKLNTSLELIKTKSSEIFKTVLVAKPERASGAPAADQNH